MEKFKVSYNKNRLVTIDYDYRTGKPYRVADFKMLLNDKPTFGYFLLLDDDAIWSGVYCIGSKGQTVAKFKIKNWKK